MDTTVKKLSHLFGRMGPVGCTRTAVRGGFAAGTSRSMCYLKRNTSRGEEVSRKVIKRKHEIICKTHLKKIGGSPLQPRQPCWTQLRCGPRVLRRWYWN